MSSDASKLDYIDSLRGMAILGVIMVHAGTSKLPFPIFQIVDVGGTGVQLFFIASAFTLFLSFKHRVNQENFPVRNFFVRRFFRIAPLYYLGICYYLFQDGWGYRYWLGNETQITILNILANLTFVQGFNLNWINSVVPGAWSIAVEMTFYLILPYLFSKIKNINQAFNFFLISIAVRSYLHILLVKYPINASAAFWQEYLRIYFPSQLPVFALGIILYFMIIEKQSLRTVSKKSVMILSAFVFLHLCFRDEIVFTSSTLFGICFLIFAYALSEFKSFIFVNPLMTYIGKVSYSMYLVHFGVAHLLSSHYTDFFTDSILNFVSKFLITLVVSILVSSILYRFIEIPFQRIGSKLINGWEKKTVR